MRSGRPGRRPWFRQPERTGPARRSVQYRPDNGCAGAANRAAGHDALRAFPERAEADALTRARLQDHHADTVLPRNDQHGDCLVDDDLLRVSLAEIKPLTARPEMNRWTAPRSGAAGGQDL